MALLYLFDSITREISSTNITFKHLSERQLAKNLVGKKFNLIALIDFISKALAMHNIKVMAKFNNITY